MRQKEVSNKYKRTGRTLPCKVCGEPYTDRIDPAVDPARGGYVICARCSMRLADAPPPKVKINPDELIDAIRNKKLARFRKSLGLTQDDLAGRLGITERQYRSIEKGKYIPSLRVIRKYERKFKIATLHGAQKTGNLDALSG